MTRRTAQKAQAVSRSAAAREGYRLAVSLVRASEKVSADDAAIERRFREAPQANFALRYLRKIVATGDPRTVEAFAAVLSDYMSCTAGMAPAARDYRANSALGLR
jgi:hypothetical protein